MVHKHTWHEDNAYCIHCGVSIYHEYDPTTECHRDKNVIAISHIVRNNNVLQTSSKNNNPNSNEDPS